MTEKQLHKLYFPEWGKARRALRSMGVSPADADARRKRIHVAAGAVKYGKPKSAKYLTNAELDRVVMAFRAISRPADIHGQLPLINQPVTRALYAAKDLLDEIGIDPFDDARERYLDGISRRACKLPLLDTDDTHLVTILGALTHTWQHKSGTPHTHRQPTRSHVPRDDAEIRDVENHYGWPSELPSEDPF